MCVATVGGIVTGTQVKRVKDSLRCANCYSLEPKDGNRVMMTCSRCKKVRYCSVACQRGDWTAHRLDCVRELPPKMRPTPS